MTLDLYPIIGQIAILPFIKVTHSKFLNGDYEIIIGWLKWELVLAWN
jgi:hypothetical protein